MQNIAKKINKNKEDNDKYGKDLIDLIKEDNYIKIIKFLNNAIKNSNNKEKYIKIRRNIIIKKLMNDIKKA